MKYGRNKYKQYICNEWLGRWLLLIFEEKNVGSGIKNTVGTSGGLFVAAGQRTDDTRTCYTMTTWLFLGQGLNLYVVV
jgi:hypothetical protein